MGIDINQKCMCGFEFGRHSAKDKACPNHLGQVRFFIPIKEGQSQPRIQVPEIDRIQKINEALNDEIKSLRELSVKYKKENESFIYEIRALKNDLRIAQEDKEELRDKFASAALVGISFDRAQRNDGRTYFESLAEQAFDLANCMMEARKLNGTK